MALNPLKPITEELAPGVWRPAGDLKHAMNVYLLEDGDGVTIFDGGTASMTEGVRRAAERIGPIKRADVEGDGGMHYFKLDQIPARLPRAVFPRLLDRWDGGPAKVSETLEEGDEIAVFVVKHFPGHAPAGPTSPIGSSTRTMRQPRLDLGHRERRRIAARLLGRRRQLRQRRVRGTPDHERSDRGDRARRRGQRGSTHRGVGASGPGACL